MRKWLDFCKKKKNKKKEESVYLLELVTFATILLFNLAGPKAAYILYVIVFGTISRYGGGEPFFIIIVLYNTFLQF